MSISIWYNHQVRQRDFVKLQQNAAHSNAPRTKDTDYHRHPVSRPPRLYTQCSRPSLPFPQIGRETPLSNNSIASVQGKFVSGCLVLIALPSRAPSPPPPPAGGSSLLFSARRWRCSRSGGRRSGRALSESPDPDKALPCGPCHSAVPAA